MTDTTTRIGILLGSAVAVVGLDYPGIGSITPTVVLVTAAFAATVWGQPQRAMVTVIECVLAISLALRIVIEYVDSDAMRIPFGTGMVADAVMVLMALYVVRTVFVTTRELVVLAWCVVVPAGAVSVVALAQVVGVPGVSVALASVTRGTGLVGRLERGVQIRATSTIGHWSSLGGYLCITIAIGCALLVYLHRSGQSTRFVAILLTLMLGGQAATLTFATIGVAGATLLSTAVYVRPRRKTVVGFGSACAAAWLAFSDQLLQRVGEQRGSTTSSIWPSTVQFRIGVWERETIPAIQDSVLSGYGSLVYRYVGTGVAPRSLQWGSPESEWLRTLIHFGAVALMVELVALGLALAAMVRLVYTYRLAPFLPLAVMAFGMTVVMSIHSHLYDRAFSILFWSVAVVAVTVRRSVPRATSPAVRVGAL